MAKKVLIPLDFNKNELQNAVMQEPVSSSGKPDKRAEVFRYIGQL